MVRGLDFNGKYLSASPTGVHRVAHELIAALARRGACDGARILAPRDILRRPDYGNIPIVSGGIFTWQFWEQLTLPWRSRGRMLVSLCNLAPLARHQAITMVHDAQVYLTPKSYDLAFRAWYRLVLPLIGHRHRRVLTVSDYSREQLVRAGVAPRERITVIHNGVDHILATPSEPEVVSRLGLEKGRFAVALSNLQAHKNVSLLLRVFADPALAGLTLVLVGAADEAAFRAAGHAVPDNIVFAGKVSDGELRGLMEVAGCLAFPSTTEGFGLPPLEAMRLGCPAVVAPCGALPEVCGDAVLYAAPDDPAAWVEAIAKLCLDPETHRHYSEHGRRHASQFTWDRAAAKLEAVIAEVSATQHRMLAAA
ncbi:MAG: glycosyltransferase family 1 protein [Novosphingobium sp.]